MSPDETSGNRGTASPAASGDERLHGEAAIIAFLVPLTAGDAGAAGLADDCAVLTPEPGTELALTTDSLIEGVHFFPGEVPSFKALAVNVSDLLASGATPYRYLLNLALPEPPTTSFMRQFTAGLAAAQAQFGCCLVGGDTDRTPGPFTITITAIGKLPAGKAVRRSTARAGDLVVVTGTIGDAGLGLLLRRELSRSLATHLTEEHRSFLVARHQRPCPNVATAELVRCYASAAMDISDGLAKDLRRLARASGVGADVDMSRVPLSAAAASFCADAGVSRQRLITAGEDYELAMAVPPERWLALQSAAGGLGIAVTAIGTITQGSEVVWRDAEGRRLPLDSEGWDHF